MRRLNKYLIFLFGLLVVIIVGGCGGIGSEEIDENKPVQISKPENLPTNPKVLIVYFSHTGNTELAAWQIQAVMGGELFRLQTLEPYPEDYNACSERAKRELREKVNPALAANLTDISKYEKIFIGYPIWYETTPMAVRTFLETHDFSGKIIAPFATSKKSDIDKSVQELRVDYPQADFVKGLILQDIGTGKMQRLITDWLEVVRGESDNLTKKQKI